jgi:hypothetical protein
MSTRKVTAVCLLSSVLWNAPAHSYEFANNSPCPLTPQGRKLNLRWIDYISNKWVEKDQNGNLKNPNTYSYFQVRFDYGAKYGDKKYKTESRPFSDIYMGACYTISYPGNGRWHAVGWNKLKQEATFGNSAGSKAESYRINIWGHEFTYDNSGAVFFRKERIGSLACELSNTCGGYGDGKRDEPRPSVDIERFFQNAGKAVEKGTQDTGKTIEKGAQDTGKTVEKGVRDTGKTIEKGAQDLGKALGF